MSRKSRFHDLSGSLMPARDFALLPWDILMRFLDISRRGPWMSRSAVGYLDSILMDRFAGKAKVLEIGGGASTVWLSKRCRDCLTLEEDSKWMAKISEVIPVSQSNIILLEGSFKKHFSILSRLLDYDIFIIDGETDENRMEILGILNRINPSAVIVLDNSDRKIFSDISKLFPMKTIEFRSGSIRKPLQVTQTAFLF